MSTPRIDFMPEEVRHEIRVRLSRRRSSLLLVLMTVSSVGVGFHSWNTARSADIARSVEAQLAANANSDPELMERLAAEQTELERALRVTDGLVPPIAAGTVIATISHMLPEQVTLTELRLEVEDSPRQMQVSLKGFAGSGDALSDFERQLARCQAFGGVTMSERKVTEFRGRRAEGFSVGFQVPLEVVVRAPGAMRVAKGDPE